MSEKNKTRKPSPKSVAARVNEDTRRALLRLRKQLRQAEVESWRSAHITNS